MTQQLEIIGADVGASTIKVVGRKTGFFPHAMHKMTDSEIATMQISEPTSAIVQSAWKVEYRVKREWLGGWIQVGTRAMRKGKGSVEFGAARYKKEYYGVLGAIGLWFAGTPDSAHVHFAGTHPSEYSDYTPDIIEAIMGQWRVTHKGVTKTFSVDKVSLMHEPVAAFRHALLPINGMRPKVPTWMKKDTVIGLDFGGFTLGVMVAESMKIDYTAVLSLPHGMLDVLDELWDSMRSEYRTQLREIAFPDMGKLRWALTHGVYPAGGYGNLDVNKLAERARKRVLNEIPAVISRMGGKATFSGVFLAGGGVADMEEAIRKAVDHPNIYLADNPKNIVYAAAQGAYRSAFLALGK